MPLTTHGDLYDWNIMKSLEKHIRDSGFTNVYNVDFGDTKFDPAMYTQWVQIVWTDFSKSIFSRNSFHVRCFSKSHDDRLYRNMEKLIGDVRNVLEIKDGVTFRDYMNHPAGNVTINFDGIALRMAIRFVSRGTVMDAEELGEASQIKGVNLVVLTYDAHVARPNVVW